MLIQRGFDKEDGVFVHSLDTVLASFNVERQGYHGGSFIGNHIHKMLKVRIQLNKHTTFSYTLIF